MDYRMGLLMISDARYEKFQPISITDNFLLFIADTDKFIFLYLI